MGWWGSGWPQRGCDSKEEIRNAQTPFLDLVVLWDSLEHLLPSPLSIACLFNQPVGPTGCDAQGRLGGALILLAELEAVAQGKIESLLSELELAKFGP